jgi:hypothetical protein
MSQMIARVLWLELVTSALYKSYSYRPSAHISRQTVTWLGWVLESQFFSYNRVDQSK